VWGKSYGEGFCSLPECSIGLDLLGLLIQFGAAQIICFENADSITSPKGVKLDVASGL